MIAERYLSCRLAWPDLCIGAFSHFYIVEYCRAFRHDNIEEFFVYPCFRIEALTFKCAVAPVQNMPALLGKADSQQAFAFLFLIDLVHTDTQLTQKVVHVLGPVCGRCISVEVMPVTGKVNKERVDIMIFDYPTELIDDVLMNLRIGVIPHTVIRSNFAIGNQPIRMFQNDRRLFVEASADKI